jgi:hypothetical protein
LPNRTLIMKIHLLRTLGLASIIAGTLFVSPHVSATICAKFYEKSVPSTQNISIRLLPDELLKHLQTWMHTRPEDVVTDPYYRSAQSGYMLDRFAIRLSFQYALSILKLLKSSPDILTSIDAKIETTALLAEKMEDAMNTGSLSWPALKIKQNQDIKVLADLLFGYAQETRGTPPERHAIGTWYRNAENGSYTSDKLAIFKQYQKAKEILDAIKYSGLNQKTIDQAITETEKTLAQMDDANNKSGSWPNLISR